ncbi:transposase [Streptomyces sp. NPDC093509]|uniref:transposase n=1 Tax=Streptomyces sp. NPDC093509 TaxID=3154982 RepID=UPI00344D4432
MFRIRGQGPIDCETGQPLDLLSGRDGATLAGWLREHPGSEIICRDRVGSYADGARTGAPHAVQVSDRFHLWRNLGSAVERNVSRHNNYLKKVLCSPKDTASVRSPGNCAWVAIPVGARPAQRAPKNY